MIKNPYYIKLRKDEATLWKGKALPLRTLDMELTERCNCNCVHCYINLPADDNNIKEKELSTEEIKGILQEAASLGCLRVRFTGGEPLLRDDFEELFVFARRLGLRVTLFTNATLITPETCKLFARIPPLEPIEITVYGMEKSSYESITRTSGSFEAAWQGIQLLLERKIPFVVKGAILPPNRAEVEKFESWASNIPWMERAPSYSMLFDLRSRRDSQRKNSCIKELRPSPEEVLDLCTRRRDEYLREMREFCSKFIRPPGSGLFSCGAGVSGGCVDAYGNLQLCMLLRHPDTVYDLKGGCLQDAIRNFFPKIRLMKAENPDYLARCGRCFLNSLCEQCPAKSWMEYGTLDTPVDYFCKITHVKARHFGLLKDNEMSWEAKDWKKRIEKFVGKRPVYQEKGHARQNFHGI